jgi:pimeloyl-ACP methyl ester carboxylesterase
MLAERGLSSLAINLSLGIDDRPAAMYDCPTPHTHEHIDAVNEIATWVGWLKEQGAGRIVLLGHSRGGNQAARYAAGRADPVVTDLVLIAPPSWDEGDAARDYAARYRTPLQPILAQAQTLVSAGKGSELMKPMGFVYCEDTRASAAAVVSYYAPDPDMDTPRLLPRIGIPVVVFAGSEDKVATGLIEKTEPLADGERIELVIMEGADHFFRDLYSEEIADALAERAGG